MLSELLSCHRPAMPGSQALYHANVEHDLSIGAISKSQMHSDYIFCLQSCLVLSASQGAFHWDIWRPTSNRRPMESVWAARKLRCVVGAADTIMFIDSCHRNHPIDR